MKDNIVVEKLDTLIKLTAASVIKGNKNQTESILKLSGVGIGNKDIAKILGTTENYVSMSLSRIKNKGKEKKKGTQESIENEEEGKEIKEESNLGGDNNGEENNNGN